MRWLALSVCVILSGCVVVAKGEQKEDSGLTTLAMSLNDQFFVVSELPTHNVFLFIYNSKTKLWDRARTETLMNAQCEHIRGYVIVTTQ